MKSLSDMAEMTDQLPFLTENFGYSFSATIPDSVLDQVKKVGAPHMIKDGQVSLHGPDLANQGLDNGIGLA